MHMLPPVGGEPVPAASNTPTSVMARVPAAVIVPVTRYLSLLTEPVCCEAVPFVRASVVLVVVTTFAEAAAPEPVPHWSHFGRLA